MRIFLLAAGLLISNVNAAPIGDVFQSDKRWVTCGKISANATGKLDMAENEGTAIITNAPNYKGAPYLQTIESYGDCSVNMEFMVSKGSNSGVYLMGRYEVQILDSHGKKNVSFSDLGGIYQLWDDTAKPPNSGGTAPSVNAAKPAGEWQTLSIRFRAPRIGEAGVIFENPVFLSVKVNGKEVQKNTVVNGPTQAHPRDGVVAKDAIFIQGDHGPIAIRKFEVKAENFSDIPPGAIVMQQKNLDLVRYGEESFHSLGCAECHSVISNDPAVRTGPSLYGVFHKTPRKREIVTADQKRSKVLANKDYLISSMRTPAGQIAIAESGATTGDPYLPIMPPYAETIVDDLRLTAINQYLLTLNKPENSGPESVIVKDTREVSKGEASMNRAEILVTSQTRAFRARLAKSSARTVYVGTPAGLNYAFDPLNLSFNRVWWGGFLNLKNEMNGRANAVSSIGHEAKEIPLASSLLVPHHQQTGEAIDLSFKNPIHANFAAEEENLYGKADFSDHLAAAGAKFRGYTMSPEKAGEPTFHYTVGENDISVTFHAEQSGKASLKVSGNFKTAQKFSLNTEAMKDASVSNGEIKDGTWTAPAGKLDSATISFTLPAAKNVWRPRLGAAPTTPVKVSPTSVTGLQLPPGYSGEQIPAPTDRDGRPQLFEPLGMDFTKDGTMVVSTRTAGVWSYKDGTWKQIADGLLDAMGVIIEKDDLSEIIIGQKPELTRLIDHDGDGVTDEYRTVSDDFLFTSNYHEYLHGPAKGGDGNYYVNLNLSCAGESRHMFKSGAAWMGSNGGYRGWCLQIAPNGTTVPFANGIRSPAGIGTGSDGLIYYSDNQGSFFGTSKFHRISKDKFYGQPASLVDLPGLSPESPELKWENVQSRNELAIALLPHGHLANSPGSPVWNLTEGKFGPTDGHIFMGDQTLSTLFQIVVNKVDGNEEAAVLPFGKGFPSGVMRSQFAPDGSLYAGQTGRGWRSQGGNEAALVHITYDPAKAKSIVENITRSGDTYTVSFSGPVKIEDASATKIKSWTYLDSPTYGSPKKEEREEKITSAKLAKDGKSLVLELEPVLDGQRLLQFAIPTKDNPPTLYYSKR